MIKKTLYFGNPAYLSLKLGQMEIRIPAVEKSKNVAEVIKQSSVVTKPIEDIGVVILDHKQITITQALLAALLENNCAVITCDHRSMPTGLFLPLECNNNQSERFRTQIYASQPLKKQLWQQTVRQKIANQAAVLSECTAAITSGMKRWIDDVRSGDADNLEGRAAAYYWKYLFSEIPGLENFTRGQDGESPNDLLNYGYAILRAVIARSLIASGMLPTLGIHHHNKYNAYCLADDIMEPYRPYVDKLVFSIVKELGVENLKLTTDIKRRLLVIPTLDVVISGRRSPLMIAATQTSASLFKCFDGELRNIAYPKM